MNRSIDDTKDMMGDSRSKAVDQSDARFRNDQSVNQSQIQGVHQINDDSIFNINKAEKKNDQQQKVTADMIEKQMQNQNNLEDEFTNIPREAFTQAALDGCTLFELLNSQRGFLSLQNYFIKAVLMLDRYAGGLMYGGQGDLSGNFGG